MKKASLFGLVAALVLAVPPASAQGGRESIESASWATMFGLKSTVTLYVGGLERGTRYYVGCDQRREGEIEYLPPIEFVARERDGTVVFTVRTGSEARFGLFRRKVQKRDCRLADGRACALCRENGFHLEDQIRLTEWIAMGDMAGYHEFR